MSVLTQVPDLSHEGEPIQDAVLHANLPEQKASKARSAWTAVQAVLPVRGGQKKNEQCRFLGSVQHFGQGHIRKIEGNAGGFTAAIG
jgi:hypothetical protein